MPRFILLLRGVNVSGANSVKMAEFRGFLTGLGLGGVETYIQSGNAVFSSQLPADDIHRTVTQAFAARFGFAPKMMIVTHAGLGEAIAGNPFTGPHVDPARLHLGFMAGEPDEGAAAALAGKQRGSAQYQIKTRVIYLFAPDGMGNSKFAQGIEKTLKVPVTFRNWRTVRALGELAAKAVD